MSTHTEDTKEMTVENLLKDIDYWKSQERNGHSFEEMNKAVEALKECVRTTLTLYASQVREKWLREEIVKLEFEKLPYPYVCKSPFPGEGVDFHLKTYGHLPDFGCCKYDQLTKEETDVHNQALQTIIDRYNEELNQPTSPVYDFFTAPEEVQRPVVEEAIKKASEEQLTNNQTL